MELLQKDDYHKYLRDGSRIGRWRQPERSNLTKESSRINDATAHYTEGSRDAYQVRKYCEEAYFFGPNAKIEQSTW